MSAGTKPVLRVVDLDQAALDRQPYAPGDRESAAELLGREICGERAVRHPAARPIVPRRTLAQAAPSTMEVGVQIEELRGDRGCQKDRDTREQSHAREGQPNGRGPRREGRELGVSALVLEGVPDAERDVRADARAGHIPDPRVVHLSPDAPNRGGSHGVEGELYGIRHRDGS